MILIPVGTKAQLIKMAPVMLALRKRAIPFDFVLTGQHQETMADLIEGFGLGRVSYTLTEIKEASSASKLAKWLSEVLIRHLRKDSILAKKNYKYCLVHGDTMSTLVGAILARRHGIKVVHIEAGLRSHNLLHPFPEELTRLVVSRLSSLFYCSGPSSLSNLNYMRRKAEIVDIGQNTLLDSVRFALHEDSETNKNRTGKSKYCVVSIHRFENISNNYRFQFILNTIISLSNRISIKFVLHAATRHKLSKTGWIPTLEDNPNIELLPRMRYFEFIRLISHSKFLISDGGSNQEECFYLDIPCLLMRKKTERLEGLGANVVLSEYNPNRIQNFFEHYEDRIVNPTHSINLFNENPSMEIALDLENRIKDKTKASR